MYKDDIDGCFWDAITITQASIFKSTERLEAKGGLVSEARSSTGGEDLAEIKGYEHEDDGSCLQHYWTDTARVLIDGIEEV